MVCEIPPLAEPVKYPGGVKAKPPFEMGVANLIDKSANSSVMVTSLLVSQFQVSYDTVTCGKI